MLTQVLDRLTALTSRYFLLGSFIPVLVFAFLNALLVFAVSERFRQWSSAETTPGALGFNSAVALVGVAVGAYILWSVNGFLRETLEGRRLIQWKRFRATQLSLRSALYAAHNAARQEADKIREAVSGWHETLSEAVARGQAEHPDKNAYDERAGNAAKRIGKVRSLGDGGEGIPAKALEDAVGALRDELERNDTRVVRVVRKDGRSHALRDDWQELLTWMSIAVDDWTARALAAANRRQTRFGDGDVAPTAFGNVAESMQSYAVTRYRLNLATFWSRLQPLLQEQKDFYAGLQDAKVQLDFLVASVFLSGLTTVFWVPFLFVLAPSAWIFLVVAAMGPILTRGLYLAAVENYVAFGEIVRTSVDLHRFGLVEALHLAQPNSLRDERILWEKLQTIVTSGLDAQVSYRHDDKGATA